MHEVDFTCDRCGRKGKGLMGGSGTSGFYLVEPPNPWNKYARKGETAVCDECMWSDPAFQKDYPGIHLSP